jgi:hypothetical protein
MCDCVYTQPVSRMSIIQPTLISFIPQYELRNIYIFLSDSLSKVVAHEVTLGHLQPRPSCT